MPHPPAGLVVYALDPRRLSDFYRAVAGLALVETAPGHVVLELPTFQLVLVQVPADVSSQIEVSEPPERREGTPLKPVFAVADLEAARATAAEHGGVLDPADREWRFGQWRVCDGHDPEGNVLQLRETVRRSAPPTVTLRPMSDAEYDTVRIPALEEFAADLARSAHAPVDDAIRARAAHFYPETRSEAVGKGAHINRVIREDGTDVGLLWLGRSPDNARTGFVYDVIIEETHRGKGLGRAAMLAAEEVLRADGCTRIALNVWGWNRRAIGLYDSLGYQFDSQQMSKSLTDEDDR